MIGFVESIKNNWSYLVGIAAVVAAIVGWLVTLHGWKRVHKNNETLERQKFDQSLKLEEEKFIASLNLDKKRAELKFVSDQIQFLYGPLFALDRASEIAFKS